MVKITQYAGPSSSKVSFPTLSLYFSYSTIVGIESKETGLLVSENKWSNTTGKHLNAICSDKKLRVERSKFEEVVSNVLKLHNLDGAV